MCAERLALVAALLLGGCAGVAEQVREHTYPRDFEYVSRGDIQSAMGQLAVHVRRLDALLVEAEPWPSDQPSETPRPNAQERDQVVRLLQAMEEVTRGLGTGDVRSNHPQLDEGIGAFRERLATARRAVERDPPNYYLAGSVSGACRYCHR